MGERELIGAATARRVAFVVPLVVVVVVTLTHLGARNGLYRSSRPDSGARPTFFLGADGYFALNDGIPVCADALHTRNLSRLFRGASGGEAAGNMDERPVAPFLQCLLGAGVVGSLWAGTLLNVLAMGAAVGCSVDLLLRFGRGPLAATTFGCLVAGGRGVGFYVGCADVHMLACAAFPVAAWLYERLDLADPGAPRSHVALFGLFVGTSLLVYMGEVALLGFVWLYGFRRTPLLRLVAMSVIAVAIAALWRGVGHYVGLRFDPHSTGSIGDGLSGILGYVRQEVWQIVEIGRVKAPEPTRAVFLGGIRFRLNSILCIGKNFSYKDPLITVTTKALVPALGLPLLTFGFGGAFLAKAREQRMALALFLPPVVAAWPINFGYDAPRITYPAATGLAILAAILFVSLGRGVASLGGRVWLGDRGRVLANALACIVLLALWLAHENSDVFGPAVIPRVLHYGY